MTRRGLCETAAVAAGLVTVAGAVLVVRGWHALGIAAVAAGFVAGVAFRWAASRLWRREITEAQEHARRVREEHHRRLEEDT